MPARHILKCQEFVVAARHALSPAVISDPRKIACPPFEYSDHVTACLTLFLIAHFAARVSESERNAQQMEENLRGQLSAAEAQADRFRAAAEAEAARAGQLSALAAQLEGSLREAADAHRAALAASEEGRRAVEELAAQRLARLQELQGQVVAAGGWLEGRGFRGSGLLLRIRYQGPYATALRS